MGGGIRYAVIFQYPCCHSIQIKRDYRATNCAVKIRTRVKGLRDTVPRRHQETEDRPFTLSALAARNHILWGHSDHLRQEEWRVFFPIWHCFKAKHETSRTLHTTEKEQEGEGTQRLTGEITGLAPSAY